jgi:hypothetical protein
MLRVVLAAVLASALVGTGFAALDTASRDRGNARVAASAERVTAAVADLRERAAPVPPDSPGARRVVTVRLPARDYATVPVEYFTIGGRPGEAPKGDAPAIAWQVEGSHERTRQVSGARVVGVDSRSPPGRLVLEAAGRHRLALTLVERDGRETVLVRRLERGPNDYT